MTLFAFIITSVKFHLKLLSGKIFAPHKLYNELLNGMVYQPFTCSTHTFLAGLTQLLGSQLHCCLAKNQLWG